MLVHPVSLDMGWHFEYKVLDLKYLGTQGEDRNGRQNLGPGCLVVVRVKEPAGQTQRRCAEVACPSTLACQGTLRLKEVSLLISYKVTNSRWVDCLMNE